MTVDEAVADAAREALSRAAGGQPSDQDAERLARLTSIDPREPLDERQIAALWAARSALNQDASGWRRMAATATGEAWRTACKAQAERAEHFADEIGDLRPGAAALGAVIGRGYQDSEGAAMTDEGDVVTPEDDAYAMYEALTDPGDEAELLDQEAEGQPIGDVWRERQQELRELLTEMELGDQVAEQEAER
jgi:hypothetical protein